MDLWHENINGRDKEKDKPRIGNIREQLDVKNISPMEKCKYKVLQLSIFKPIRIRMIQFNSFICITRNIKNVFHYIR